MMSRADRVTVRAHASITNLGYGFDVFGVCVDAGFDEVEVGPGRGGIEVALVGDGCDDIPRDPDRNTAGRAIRAVLSEHGPRQSIRVLIRKGTRPGSGLGSSAASAAAAVVAVDRFLELGLSKERLVYFAAEGERASAGAPHPDNVAASICGGFTIVSNESPLRLLSLHPPASLRFVIATPRLRVTTARARGTLPERVSLAEYSRGSARSAMIVAAILSGDAGALGRAIEGSFVDACREPLIPGCRGVFQAARDAGAAGATISGAGPTIAAVAKPDADGDAIARAMAAAFADAGLESDARVVAVAGGACIVECDA